MKNILILLLTVGIVHSVAGQNMKEKIPTLFDRKIIWGFTYQQDWSTIKGNSLPEKYFAKPSLGILATVEYYPLKFIGISLGAGYQQRGATIEQGNPPVYPFTQTSYQERLRFNTVEVPISILLRTPKDLIKGLRLSGSAGILPIMNLSSRDVNNDLNPSVDDTDIVRHVSSSYFKNDMAYQLTIGPEIDCAGTGIFRIHFMYSRGTTNVYKAGQGNGQNQSLGIRLSFLF